MKKLDKFYKFMKDGKVKYFRTASKVELAKYLKMDYLVCCHFLLQIKPSEAPADKVILV